MTFTRENLKAMKEGATKLEKKVINVLLDQGDSEDIEIYIKDVMQGGCQSGIVGELIYHNDTVAFFEKYKKDIINLVNESFENTGYKSFSELFGDKWDNEDPLAEEVHNQNLLAWFGFEETVYRIANQFNLV